MTGMTTGNGDYSSDSPRMSAGKLIKTLNMITAVATAAAADNDYDENDDMMDETSGSSLSTSESTTMNSNSHYYSSHMQLAPTLIHSNSQPQHHHHLGVTSSSIADHHLLHPPQGHYGQDISRFGPSSNSSSSSSSLIPQMPTAKYQHHPHDDDHQKQKQTPQQKKLNSPLPPLSQFIPPLLKQAKDGGAGLAKIPQKTLFDNLKPVIHALQQLDAVSLLDLATISSKAPGCGPKVQDGVYCRPIVDEIKPPLNSLEYLRNGHSCVRYLHIAEIPDQYSIGIFVFGPYARIPLHDHPDMCVLSRVLYGDLQRQSLDLARDSDIVKTDSRSSVPTSTSTTTNTNEDGDATMSGELSSSLSSSWSMFSRGPGSWFHSSSPRPNNSSSGRTTDGNNYGNNHHDSEHHSHHHQSDLPLGSKYAYRNSVDHLEAPGVTVLYPYEGNLHEFVAGEYGAAVLDVLLPPYDNEQNRDCIFYNIINLLDNAATKLVNYPGKEPCMIVPTHQPESFHCISGTYRDLGEINDDDDDESSDFHHHQ